MSERMNKERAIEILKKIRHNSIMQTDYTIDDIDQALDIAIESLDNTMTNREYMHLVGVQAILNTKFDLDKPLEKDFVKFLYALNQVEPYDRKE